MKRSPTPGEVRLIGGQWKRSKLPVPNRPGLRPTPDRVRETLFNWLGQDLSGWAVLDAFAGSGALGFEAASRGARRVQMLEADSGIARSLATTAQRLQAPSITVQSADAMAWMRRAEPGQFDLILLDPPFEADLFMPACAAAMPLLRPGGWLYLEAPAQFEAESMGMVPHRHLKAGAVHAHLWMCSKATAA